MCGCSLYVFHFFFIPTMSDPRRPRLRGVHGDRGGKDRSASSSEDEEAAAPAAPLSLSPPSLLSLPSFKDVGNEKGGEKEVWVSVFKYMNRAELLTCMTVCKAWYKWYVGAAAVLFFVYEPCAPDWTDHVLSPLPPPPAGAATSASGAT